jgi:transposase
MYIKKIKKRNGRTKQVYEYLHLVESIRTEKGPRQKLVLNLGTIDIAPPEYEILAKRIEAILSGKPSLPGLENIPDEKIERHAQKTAHAIVKKQEKELNEETSRDYQMVDLNSIDAEEPRSLGAEYIAHQVWKELKLNAFFERHGVSKEVLPIIEAVIIGRLIEPASELHTRDWVEKRSALYELIDRPHRYSHNSYYRAGDRLLELKDELERHLTNTEKDLFSLNEHIFLMDLTNTYFEGEALANPKAKYGRSKEKRHDCKQVTLGLIIDDMGFAKSSKVFSGNQAEVETLGDMITGLENMMSAEYFYTNDKRTVVIDAGIASEDNLSYLRDNKYNYIAVNRGKAPFDKEYSDMTVIRNDESEGVKIEVKRFEHEGEVYILCRSEKKKGKESGIRSRVENLFLDRLKYIHSGLKLRNRPKRYTKIIEIVGRLKEKYPKAGKLYNVEVIPEHGKDTGNPFIDAVNITWEKKDSIYDEEVSSEGTYILRTNRSDLSDEEIWKIYIMLNRIEYAFKSLKSSLGLRPNFHQKEHRVDTHLFISILAYHILHIIEHRLRSAGDHRSWATIRDIMKTHQRITITYQTREDDLSIRKHFTRVTSICEQEHLDIYCRLNLSPDPLPRKKALYQFNDRFKGVVTTLSHNH